jgi:hypothetical protein
VLDLPWRYKLILPTVASLPLICTYNGGTTVLMPTFVRPLLWADGAVGAAGAVAGGQLTALGSLINAIVPVDAASHGALVELGAWGEDWHGCRWIHQLEVL